MSGAQDHARRLARLECFLPTRSTEAPTVAGFQATDAEFRHRCRKIVAAGFGKLEKRGDHGADRVATDVLSPTVAAAVSKEPRDWAYRADFEPLTEHVTGCVRPTASIPLSSLSIAVSACGVVDRLLIFGESHLPLPTRAKSGHRPRLPVRAIFCRHYRMARVPAVGAAPIGRERVGLGVSAILTFRARSSRLHRCAS